MPRLNRNCHVRISGRVQSIRRKAFEASKNVLSVTFDPKPGVDYQIGYGAFRECASLEYVHVNGEHRDNFFVVLSEAFSFCTTLVRVELKIKFIQERTFYGCKSLEEYDAEGTEIIHSGAFMGSGLRRVLNCDGLALIEKDAFTDSRLQRLCAPNCKASEPVAVGCHLTYVELADRQSVECATSGATVGEYGTGQQHTAHNQNNAQKSQN